MVRKVEKELNMDMPTSLKMKIFYETASEAFVKRLYKTEITAPKTKVHDQLFKNFNNACSAFVALSNYHDIRNNAKKRGN